MKTGKLLLCNMETIGKLDNNNKLPILREQQEDCCAFNGYNASLLMSETAKLRRIIKARNT